MMLKYFVISLIIVNACYSTDLPVTGSVTTQNSKWVYYECKYNNKAQGNSKTCHFRDQLSGIEIYCNNWDQIEKCSCGKGKIELNMTGSQEYQLEMIDNSTVVCVLSRFIRADKGKIVFYNQDYMNTLTYEIQVGNEIARLKNCSYCLIKKPDIYMCHRWSSDVINACNRFSFHNLDNSGEYKLRLIDGDSNHFLFVDNIKLKQMSEAELNNITVERFNSQHDLDGNQNMTVGTKFKGNYFTLTVQYDARLGYYYEYTLDKFVGANDEDCTFIQNRLKGPVATSEIKCFESVRFPKELPCMCKSGLFKNYHYPSPINVTGAKFARNITFKFNGKLPKRDRYVTEVNYVSSTSASVGPVFPNDIGFNESRCIYKLKSKHSELKSAGSCGEEFTISELSPSTDYVLYFDREGGRDKQLEYNVSFTTAGKILSFNVSTIWVNGTKLISYSAAFDKGKKPTYCHISPDKNQENSLECDTGSKECDCEKGTIANYNTTTLMKLNLMDKDGKVFVSANHAFKGNTWWIALAISMTCLVMAAAGIAVFIIYRK